MDIAGKKLNILIKKGLAFHLQGKTVLLMKILHR